MKNLYLPLVLRAIIVLTGLLIILIGVVSVSARTMKNSCLVIEAHELKAGYIQSTAFPYLMIDAVNRKILKASPANDLYTTTDPYTRTIRISPNGKRIAFTGADTPTHSRSYMGIFGATPTLPRIALDTYPINGGINVEWMTDSRRVIGWYRDESGINTIVFVMDENGQTRSRSQSAYMEFVQATQDGHIIWYIGQEFVIWSAETLVDAGNLNLDRPFVDKSGKSRPDLWWHPTNKNTFAYLSRIDDTHYQLHIRTLDRELIDPPGLVSRAIEGDSFSGVTVDWSPDGNYLIVSYGSVERRHMYVVDVKHGGKLLFEDELYPHSCSPYCNWPVFAWKPDGSGFIYPSQISTGTDEYFAFYRDLTDYSYSSQQRTPLISNASEYYFLSNGWFWVHGLSASSKVNIMATHNGGIIQLATDPGSEPELDGFRQTLFSPITNTVFMRGADKTNSLLFWVDFDTKIWNSVPIPAKIVFKGWSPNDRAVAYEAGNDMPRKPLWVLDTETKQQTQVATMPPFVYHTQPSNDARFLVLAYSEFWTNTYALEVREIKTGRVTRTVNGLAANPDWTIAQSYLEHGALLWSSDGRFVALYTKERVAIVEIKTGNVLDYPLVKNKSGTFWPRWSEC